MMCTINGNSLCTFTKNTWIGDTGTSCHITHNDTGMFEIEQIDESVIKGKDLHDQLTG